MAEKEKTKLPFEYWDKKLATLTKDRVAGEPQQYWPKSMYANQTAPSPSSPADFALRSLSELDTSGPVQGPPIPSLPTPPSPSPVPPSQAYQDYRQGERGAAVPPLPPMPVEPPRFDQAAYQAFRAQEQATRSAEPPMPDPNSLRIQGEYREANLSPYEQFQRSEMLDRQAPTPKHPFQYRPEDFNPVQQSTVEAITPPSDPNATVKPQDRANSAGERDIQAQIDAELARVGRVSAQEAREWGQRHRVSEADRRQLAFGIAKGWVDASQVPSEMMPWDQLAYEPGYQRIGQLGMRDPAAAMRYIVDLQKTASSGDLQDVSQAREKVSREMMKVRQDPAALLDHLVEGNWRTEWIKEMPPNDPSLMAVYDRILDPMQTGTAQMNMSKWAQGPFFAAAAMSKTNPQAAKDMLMKEFEARSAGARGFLPATAQSFQSLWEPQLAIPETGWQMAGNLTGGVVRELPLVFAAGALATPLMGTTAAGRAGLAALEAGEGLNAARFGAGAVHAGLTGGIRGVMGEGIEAMRDPQGYDISGAPGRVAANAAEFAAYSPAYQVLEAGGEAGGHAIGKLTKGTKAEAALAKLVENPAYKVAQKGVTGLAAGATVGLGKATGEAIIQTAQDPKSFSTRAFLRTVADNAKEEMGEELVEAMTYGMLNGEMLGSPSHIENMIRTANGSEAVQALLNRLKNLTGTPQEIEQQRAQVVEDLYKTLVEEETAQPAPQTEEPQAPEQGARPSEPPVTPPTETAKPTEQTETPPVEEPQTTDAETERVHKTREARKAKAQELDTKYGGKYVSNPSLTDDGAEGEVTVSVVGVDHHSGKAKVEIESSSGNTQLETFTEQELEDGILMHRGYVRPDDSWAAPEGMPKRGETVTVTKYKAKNVGTVAGYSPNGKYVLVRLPGPEGGMPQIHRVLTSEIEVQGAQPETDQTQTPPPTKQTETTPPDGAPAPAEPLTKGKRVEYTPPNGETQSGTVIEDHDGKTATVLVKPDKSDQPYEKWQVAWVKPTQESAKPETPTETKQTETPPSETEAPQFKAGQRVRFFDSDGKGSGGTVISGEPTVDSFIKKPGVMVRFDSHPDKPVWAPLDRLQGFRFGRGQRVQYTNKKGENLTGTVRSDHWGGESHVTVSVDQIAHAGGVPIGRVEDWPVDEVKSFEEGKTTPDAKTESPQPDAKGADTKATGEVAQVAASLRAAGVKVNKVVENHQWGDTEQVRIYFDNKLPDDAYQTMTKMGFKRWQEKPDGTPARKFDKNKVYYFSARQSDERAAFARELQAELAKEVPQATTETKAPEATTQPPPAGDKEKGTEQPTTEGTKAPDKTPGEKKNPIKLTGIPANQIDRIRRELEDKGKATYINATIEIEHIGPENSQVREFHITRDGRAVTIRDTNLNDERAVERAIEYLAVWSGSGRPSDKLLELSANELTVTIKKANLSDKTQLEMQLSAAARVGFESFWRDLVPTVWGDQAKFDADVKDATDIRAKLDHYWARKERGLSWPVEAGQATDGESKSKEVTPQPEDQSTAPPNSGQPSEGSGTRQTTGGQSTKSGQSQGGASGSSSGGSTGGGTSGGRRKWDDHFGKQRTTQEDPLLVPYIDMAESLFNAGIRDKWKIGVPIWRELDALAEKVGFTDINDLVEKVFHSTDNLGRLRTPGQVMRELIEYRDGKRTGPSEEEKSDEQTDGMGQIDDGTSGGASPEDVRGAEGGGDAGRAGDQRSGKSEGSTRGSDSRRDGVRPGAGDGATGEHSSTERGGSAGAGSDTESGTSADGGVKSDPSKDVETAPRPEKHNYRITDDDALGEGGQVAKYKGNVAAIRLLKQLEREGRRATPEEQAVLVKYVGWGPVRDLFDERKIHEDWAPRRKELKELLTPDEYDAASRSSQYAHYTSKEVVNGMYKILQRLGFNGGRVLEPSMGIGHFFGLMPEAMAKRSRLHGIEIDPTSARIAAQLYQNADVREEGFEKNKYPKDYFDLVIGNPPFQDLQLNDPDYNKYNLMIHDYFTVRSLDLLRPGGLLLFVNSAGVLDKQNIKARELMAKKADLVGAIRLPGDAFAKNANTFVTTDILVFRKRMEGEAEGDQSWVNTSWHQVPEVGNVPVNSYFLAHPEMVLGKFGKDRLTGTRAGVLSTEGDLGEKLAEATDRLPENLYQPPAAREIPQSKWEPVAAPTEIKDGSYFLEGGKLYRKEGAGRVEVTEAGTKSQRIRDMIPLRQGARTLLYKMANSGTEEEIQTAQKHLNAVYDSFVKKHGYIHTRENVRAFAEETDLPFLLAMEKWDKDTQKATKTDMFTQRVIQPLTGLARATSSKDALVVSLAERGRVDWERIAALLPDSDRATIEKELLREDLVYEAPDGDWQTKEEYLSGNVRRKLLAARTAAKADERFLRNVDALESILPKTVPLTDVWFRIGAPWIPIKVVAAFVNDLLNTSGGVSYTHIPAVGLYTMKKNNNLNSALAESKWGTEDKPLHELVLEALKGKTPEVKRKDEDGKSFVDDNATLAAKAKLEDVQKEFKRWVFANASLADKMTTIYNERYNAEVPRIFDGTHLTLPGITQYLNGRLFKLRAHQLNAIWRIMQSPTVLLHHVVGAGKTFTMIGGAMELRRLGLANKPMIVVPNHLVTQWEKDILRMYPGANVLTLRKDDLQAASRKQTTARVATGNWDVVLLPKSSFTKIGMSAEAQAKFIQKEIKQYKDMLDDLPEEDKKTSRELENRLEKLENRLAELQAEQHKDDVMNFEELGVDALFVDEAHEFKNLGYPTTRQKISGINNAGNQMTTDLYMKVQYLREMQGRVVFATGTPISNSIGEMFTFMRYLHYANLEELDLHVFDGWANMFGEEVEDLELHVSGKGFVVKKRFNRFNNLPELMRLYLSFTDVLLAHQIPKEDLPRPPLIGGIPEIVSLKATEWIKSFVNWLADRYVTAKDPRNTEDNVLLVVTDGRKAATDRRLVERNVPDAAKQDSKVMAAAERIYRLYKEHNADKGTQLVFSDLGAPAKKDKSQFTVYQALKDLLMEAGIPANEIAFIHDAKDDEAKLELFDRMNRGAVRVLIGSSQKMGAGMNVQQRLVALHHIDPPWRPLDIEQREGRILRQGNELWNTGKIKGVQILRYIQEGSFDGYMWQTLQAKAHFIGQVLTSTNPNERWTDDISEVVLPGVNEAKAQGSGSESARKKIRLMADYARYNALEAAYNSERYNISAQIRRLPELIARLRAEAAALRKDAKKVEDVSGERFTIKLVADEKMGAETMEFTDRKKAIPRLALLMNDFNPILVRGKTGTEYPLGEFAGLKLILVRGNFDRHTLVLRGEADHTVSFGTTMPGTLQSMEYVVRSSTIERTAEMREKGATDSEQELAAFKQEIDKPFAHTDDLARTVRELAEVDLKIAAESQVKDDTPQYDPRNYVRKRSDSPVDDEDGADVAGLTTDGETASMAKKKAQRRPQTWPGRSLTPETVRTIADRLAKAINVVVRGTKPQIRRAEGTYNFKTDAARVKPRSFDAWRVIGHELGHALDDQTGFTGDKVEIRAVARKFYPGGLNSKNIDREGKTEFFTLWFTDPQLAQKEAPNTYGIWLTYLQQNPHLNVEISKIRALVDADLALPTVARATMATRWNPEALLPTLRRLFTGNYSSWREKVKGWGRNLRDEVGSRLDGQTPLTRGSEYRVPWHKRPLWRIVDRAIPLTDLYKRAVSKGYKGVDLERIASIGGNVLDRAKAAFEFRPRDEQMRFITNGRTLQSVAQAAVDLIGNTMKWQEIDRPDGQRMGALHLFDAYLKARRALERYQHAGFKGPMDPNTGLWMTYKEAQDTVTEMERTFAGIDKLAAEYSSTLSDIILSKLERAGIMDGKQRTVIEKGSLPEYYIPIIYDETPRSVSGSETEGHAVKNPVKRFKGKDASTRDFITATISRLAEVEQAIRFKAVLDAVTKALKQDGMGAFGEFDLRPLEATTVSMKEINERLERLVNQPLPFDQLGVAAMTFWKPGAINSKEPVLVNIVDGKPVFIRVAPDVFEALMAMEPVQLEAATKLLAKVGRGFRLAALLRPVTMLNIWFRDLFTVSQQGDKAWVKNVPAAAASVVKAIITDHLRQVGAAVGLPDDLYQLYVESGGYGGSFASILEGLSGKAGTSLLNTNAPGLKQVVHKGKKWFGFVVSSPTEALRFMEEYPRLAEWMSVFKVEVDKLGAGITGKEALELVKQGQISRLPLKVQSELERILVDSAYASHEVTVNAARAGSSKFVRQYVATVPFLQGNLQGIYRTYRHWRETPGKAAKRQLLLVTFTALAWAYRMADDDDEKAYYADLPQDVKDRYWPVRVPGTGLYVFVAKPYDHAIMTNTMERYLDWSLLHEKGRAPLQSWIGMVAKSFTTADPVNQSLMGAIHLYAGHDEFGPIVPRSEQGLATYQAAGPNTSRFAQALAKLQAKALNDPRAGWKAREIDYMLKQVIPFGGWITTVGNVLAVMAEEPGSGVMNWLEGAFAAGGDNRLAGAEFAPVIGAILRGKTEGGSRKVERFYDDYAKAQDWDKIVREHAKKQDGIPPGMTEQIANLVGAIPAMDAISKELGATRKQMDSEMKDSTPEERKLLLVRYQYVQRLATGLLYGDTPVPPDEAELHEETIRRWTDHFEGIISDAIGNAAKREGGSDEVAQLIRQALSAKKKGRP